MHFVRDVSFGSDVRFARSLQSASGVGASPAGKEPKQKPRGDCLEAFVLAPPVGLEPATP